MEAAKPVQRLSEREYLERERRAEFKSEFYDGEMFAMSGGSRWHSLIAANCIGALQNRLTGGPCLVYDSNLRVKIEATGLYTYPDVTIACEEQRFADDAQDTLLNPTVLIEVLSDSTEAYDRGKKFEHYRRLSSLREYLLINQKEPHVELFVRLESGEWILREALGLETRLTIPSLNVTIALAEVFAKVEFSPVVLHSGRSALPSE